MQIISNTALISINETIIVQLILFLVFVFIMNRVMFRPLQSSMEERRSYINKIQQDIIKAEKLVEEHRDQLAKQKAAAQAEAFEIAQTLEDEGAKTANGLLDATRKEMQDFRIHAQADIDAKLMDAREQIQKESETVCLSMMEKVLQRRIVS